MSDRSSLGLPREALPIFPLTGVLLLPGGRLPLYIFEPRYRSLVEDALAADGHFGLVQPKVADPADNRGPDGDEAEPAAPEIYPVGCAGLVEHHERLDDGRYVVLMKGVWRFRATQELEPLRGYRRVAPDYSEFDDAEGGREASFEVDHDAIASALVEFGTQHQLDIDLDQLNEVEGLALLNSVAMALPFAPAEKQALLEAPTVGGRQELLLTLLAMGLTLDVEPPATN
ncbi:MAG: LON peptidase substrate-binding domain-containing protein [Acidobacteriota bacterium]